MKANYFIKYGVPDMHGDVLMFGCIDESKIKPITDIQIQEHIDRSELPHSIQLKVNKSKFFYKDWQDAMKSGTFEMPIPPFEAITVLGERLTIIGTAYNILFICREKDSDGKNKKVTIDFLDVNSLKQL